MVEPIPPCPRSHQRFCVLDIENDEEGNVLTICTAWRKGRRIVYDLRTSWDEWWEWHVALCEMEKWRRTIYAHNGGGWDWISLIEWLCSEGKGQHKGISIAAPQSKVILSRVMTTKRFQLILADSIELLRAPLSTLASFVGLEKIDLKEKLPHEVHATDRQLFESYAKRDCEILLLVLESALRQVRRRIARIDNLPVTIGGAAMRIFRSGYQSRAVFTPWRTDLKETLRQAYCGGRVEMFRAPRVYPHVYVYDVNSMYAAVMTEQSVPFTGRAGWVKAGHQLEPGEVGVYYVRWQQSDKSIPPILHDNLNYNYDGEGLLYSPELHCFRRSDPGGSLDICGGYTFLDCGLLLADYAERIYKLRLSERGKLLGWFAKGLLVSLWGKFGQRQERETIVAVPTFAQLFDRVASGATIRPLNLQGRTAGNHAGTRGHQGGYGGRIPVFAAMGKSYCHHEHCGIAGTIASAARARLYDGILLAGKSLVYCDTDSLHTTEALPDKVISPDRLGAWKLEDQGVGVYLALKTYAIRRQDGSERIAAKGIAVGGRHGADLRWEDMFCALDTGRIETGFGAATTAQDVFAGRRACNFRSRRKTIKVALP